ncbi:GpE family phage tail protein [Morganella morganii subsp. morganii]|nr:GpE family phage tail protein [Morganella morganii subsp. morganii]
MPGLSDRFFGVSAWHKWRQLSADVTYFYHWGPQDARYLTMRELLWWAEQANRINSKE